MESLEEAEPHGTAVVAVANGRMRKFLLFIQLVTWCGGLIDIVCKDRDRSVYLIE